LTLPPGGTFTFVPHTADLAVCLRAASRPGLFETAAAALVEAITDPAAVRAVEERTVVLEGTDLELLLVDWLHELLYLFETEDFLPADTQVAFERDEGPHRLTALVRGELRDESRHPIKVLIKAVTYHGLEIVPRGQGYEATVIFDI
jgi:SHS2 domain-containing protein